jgi:hypothetical protein
MDVIIDFNKSAQQNAEEYFESSKKFKRKKEGAVQIILELKNKAKKQEKQIAFKAEDKKLKEIVKKEWYEKFKWFFTSNGMLVIAGRDASQNELLNSKYFDEHDLFFHADIFGAPVVILKNGSDAEREIKEEVSQFAASHSRAWEQGSNSVDVYSMRRDQVSKSKAKGSLGTGSFLLEGQREWYKGVVLELCAFLMEIPSNAEIKDNEKSHEISEEHNKYKVAIAPAMTCHVLNIEKRIDIKPGNTKKSDAAQKIASILKADVDTIMQLLPAGSFSIKQF